MISVLLLAQMLLCAGAEPVADSAEERQRQQAVAVVAPAKARMLRVNADTTRPTESKLHSEPLLRWSNATAGSIYGEVFLWSVDDRPVAIASIYRWYDPYHDSTVEIASLAESPLDVREGGVSVWKAPARGVNFRQVAGAPASAATRGARLGQMRAIARRFSAKLTDDRGGEQVVRELRLLNQPVHRYASESSGIVDGALFVFAEATDPEVLLVVEAIVKDGQQHWRYGLARMNAHALEIRHDAEVVQRWVRVTDPAKDPTSTYAYFNFDPALVNTDRQSTPAP